MLLAQSIGDQCVAPTIGPSDEQSASLSKHHYEIDGYEDGVNEDWNNGILNNLSIFVQNGHKR